MCFRFHMVNLLGNNAVPAVTAGHVWKQANAGMF